VAAVFFFKQKTAYEMPKDWSSDVCSSDLAGRVAARARRCAAQRARADQPQAPDRGAPGRLLALPLRTKWPQRHVRVRDAGWRERSEERRVGKEWSARWCARQQRKKHRCRD